jgi:hypothetical protein
MGIHYGGRRGRNQTRITTSRFSVHRWVRKKPEADDAETQLWSIVEVEESPDWP